MVRWLLILSPVALVVGLNEGIVWAWNLSNPQAFMTGVLLGLPAGWTAARIWRETK